MLLKTIIITLLSTLCLAMQVTIDGENLLQDCTQSRSKSHIYCLNEEGSQFVLKKYGWEYIALKKDGDGKLKNVTVSSVTSDSGDEAYIRRMTNQDKYQDMQSPLTGELLDLAKEEYIYNNFIKYDLDRLVEDTDGRIYDLLKDAGKEFEKKRKEIDQDLKSKKLRVKLSNDSTIMCKRERDKSCPVLKCEKDKDGRTHLLVKSRYSNSSFFTSFPLVNGVFTPRGAGVNQILSKDDRSLIKYEPKEQSSAFMPSMMVPSAYKQNPDLFMSMSDIRFSSFLKNSLVGCSSEVQKLYDKIQRKISDDRDTAKMVQYIDLSNGLLQSFYVNEDSLPEHSCYYKGAFYGPEGYKAAKKLSPITKSTITPAKAQDLLDQARARTDIAWNYTLDGCYARAHLMARMFEQQGVHTSKAWIRGKLKIPENKRGLNWGYHVAPIVYVEDKDGKIKEMVIDPSISKAPLLAKDWAALMKVDFNETEQVPFPTPTNTEFYNKTSYSVTTPDAYWPDQRLSLTEEDKMNMAKETMLNYGGEPLDEDSEWAKWE